MKKEQNETIEISYKELMEKLHPNPEVPKNVKKLVTELSIDTKKKNWSCVFPLSFQSTLTHNIFLLNKKDL